MSSTITKSGGSWIKREKRWAIYLRDDLRCLYCTTDLRENLHNLTLHHLIGEKNHAHSNLVTCCKTCADQKKRGGLAKFDMKQVKARINAAIRKPIDLEAGRKAYLETRDAVRGKGSPPKTVMGDPTIDYGLFLPADRLAEATVTTVPYLAELVKEGKVPEPVDGKYDVVRVFQALLALERERAASGEGAKMADEKLRKLTAEREREEYRNLKEQGKMVEKEWAFKFCVNAGIIIKQQIAACQSLSHDDRDNLLEEIATKFHEHAITESLESKGD